MNTILTEVTYNHIMPDVTDWLTITEASEESGYSSLWLRELIRKYLGADNPPFDFVKKGNMYLLEPRSFRKYCERMKREGTGKHDPTRRPHKP